MNNNLWQIVYFIRDKLLLYSSISIGLFLFILFFQPFPTGFADLNSVLIFAAGLGAITFLLLFIIRLFFSIFRQEDKEALSYFNGFIYLLLSSVAFTFYLRYVGHTVIGFFIIAKIILVNLAPPIALRIFRLTHEMRLENNLLVKEKSILQQQLQSIADANKLITIEFYSTDNQSEALKLALSDIVLVKSADNYVEIYYKDNSGNRKKLIRNTLKNVEQLLSPYALFIRCHRTCIINTGYIDKLYHKINSSYILVKELDERIPVSRQYILKLKEATAKIQG